MKKSEMKTAAKAMRHAVKEAGNQSKLARKLAAHPRIDTPIKQAHVHFWLNRGYPPAEVVIPIEQVLDGAVSRHNLRPDIYPVEAT